MPIGSDAEYKPAHFEPAGHVGADIQHIILSYPAYDSYPVYNSPSWGPGRCSGETYLGFDLRIPGNLIIPDAGDQPEWGLTPNSNWALLYTEDSTVLEGNKISRCTSRGPVYLPEWMKYPENRRVSDIRGDGISGGGQGASGMSAFGGTIRLGELTGNTPIRHVIKINPWAAKYVHYSERYPGYKWPAMSADSYAAERYNRDADSSILMGALFAIPPGITAEEAGIRTVPGRKLFDVLQQFGMYFTEDAAWDTWDLIVERGVETEFADAYGFSLSGRTWLDEMNRLMQSVSVVMNNGPSSIGGGGIPIVPLAPDMASPPSDPASDIQIMNLIAAEREKLPVQGRLIYDPVHLDAYGFLQVNGAGKRIESATGEQLFGKKFVIDVQSAGKNPWEPQLKTPSNDITISRGDVLLYILHARTVDTEVPNDFGSSYFHIQENRSPWTTIGSQGLSLSTSWKRFYVIIRAGRSFAPGEMAATFHLGLLQQEVEIGGVFALNLGPDVKITDLPGNELSYHGMEPGAEWRKEAEARIEKYRKGDITVKVTDSSGRPVKDAHVSIQMKSHAYGFGTFMSDYALQPGEDAEIYRDHIRDLFNCATTPFYMGGNTDSWGWYGSLKARESYPLLAQWLEDEGMPAKGHVLIWPGWKYMPSWFEAHKDDPETLNAGIDTHLEKLVPVGMERGLEEWDVVNEPWVNHDVMDILGEDILAHWYEKVHALHPSATLILNEYNILMAGGRQPFQDNLERLVYELIASGAPLGGIGMQCHFDEALTGIPEVLDILDRFAKTGLPIQVTEFDVGIRDEEMQARYLEDFYTAVFSHPATEKIVMWGFYEKVMWRPLGALVRSDGSLKPAYHAYRRLVHERWWTPDTTGVTGMDGTFSINGYYGKYDITVETGGCIYTLKDSLVNRDTVLEVVVQ